MDILELNLQIDPKSVHIHVKSFSIKSLPGFDVMEQNEKSTQEFNKWVRKRFMEKDDLLKEFYDSHKFQEKGLESHQRIVSIQPKILDILSLLILGISLYWTVPFYISLVGSLFKFILEFLF